MNQLWTVSLDFGGTGEGRTLLAWIGYATSGEQARDAFGGKFGSFFSRISTVEPGIVRNSVVEHLVAQATLDVLSRGAGRSTLEFFAHLHVNAA